METRYALTNPVRRHDRDHGHIRDLREIVAALMVMDCSECGVLYALGEGFSQRRREDGATWYCPNGHSQHYVKSQVQKLREERDRAMEQRRYMMHQRDAARQLAETERRSAAAYKGHLTRMRNRVARGVCPQPGCKRSWTSLAEHVRNEHPHLLDKLPELGD